MQQYYRQSLWESMYASPIAEDRQLRRVSAKQEQRLATCRMCAERPYLTLQVPSDAEAIYEVNFTISSHDQGW